MIDTEKLLQITALDAGAHDATSGAMCAMEAVAWIVGEPLSDAPQCASPVVAAFVRSWNDALPNADRTRLLLPLIPEIVGTSTTDADEEARTWMTTDWLVRVHTPAWLRLAGLTDHAQALESCARLVDAGIALAEQPKIFAARDAANAAANAAAKDAAKDAVGDAAWYAARDAVTNAAWDAARDAARDAAWYAAMGAAINAAWYAARGAAWYAAMGAARGAARGAANAAARDELAPTIAVLQASACDLVRAMCAVGRVAAAEREVASE